MNYTSDIVDKFPDVKVISYLLTITEGKLSSKGSLKRSGLTQIMH